MGASNVAAVYVRYAGKVPPLSMQVLAYMALVSLDSDPWPWFGQGHAALAEHALGRPSPIGDDDLRAVRRAITPLVKVGAIHVDRRGAVRRAGPSTTRYRLDVGQISSGVTPTQDPPHRTESDPDVGRKVAAHRTESVPDVGRKVSAIGTKRNQEEREEEEKLGLGTDLTVSRASADDQAPEMVETGEPDPPRLDTPDLRATTTTPSPTRCEHGIKIRRRPDGSSSCAICRRAVGPSRPPSGPPPDIPADRSSTVVPFRRRAA